MIQNDVISYLDDSVHKLAQGSDWFSAEGLTESPNTGHILCLRPRGRHIHRGLHEVRIYAAAAKLL